MAASYKVACKTPGDKTWSYNSLRFSTHAGAEAWGYDLYLRWTLLTVYEIHESDDPPNRED